MSAGFSRLDGDGDGKLSASELSAALKAFQPPSGQNAAAQATVQA